MASRAIEPTAWEESASGAFPMRDDGDSEALGCAECAQSKAELAKARALLRSLAKIEAKAAKPDMLMDDPLECQVIGLATALAVVRARIELFLARKA